MTVHTSILPDDFDQKVLSSAKALRSMGFGVHWLHTREKRPIGDGWQNGPARSIEQLISAHRAGNNIGVRLGEFSKLVDGSYLHVFDFDIRVADMADEAWAAFEKLFPNVRIAELPMVASGSGGESRHLYFTTSEPFRGKVIARSEGKHRRFDATKGGDVWSNDFEIELFGTGKQVVLPPSIHPDTGNPYRWEREFDFHALAMGLSPHIPAADIEAIGVPKDEKYAFEDRAPLDFKDGQMERHLSNIEVSDLHYDDWIILGQAIHHQLGGSEAGFALWLEHTKRSTKHDGDIRTMRKKYRSFGKYRGRAVTMASVVEWSKAAVVSKMMDQFEDEPEEPAALPTPETPGNADPDADPLATMFGEPAGTAAPAGDFLAGFDDPDDFDDLTAAAAPNAALEWVQLLDLNDAGAIKPTLHNVEMIVENDIRLSGLPQLNEFTLEPVQRTAPGMKGKMRRNAIKATRQLEGRIWNVKDPLNGDLWSDDRDFAIRSIIEAPKNQGGYSLKISDRDLKAATVLAASRSAFHPVREYLEKHTWDGVPRMEQLFTQYLGAPDDAYTRSVSRLMMVAAVTRIYEPGHKWDFCVVLEGIQGKRKSTFIRVLARHWFGELHGGDFSDTKQMVELMAGKWIMEIPELSGFSRADVRAIKAFISAQSDRARLAYARRACEFPRQSIFIGSTNDSSYLRDETGGRRFWPVACMLPAGQDIDTNQLSRNIDQLWAEAAAKYHAMRAEQPFGDLPLYLREDAARTFAEQLQESRRIETPEDGLAGQIAAWLEKPICSGSFDEDNFADGTLTLRNETCNLQIWRSCLGGEGIPSHAYCQMIGRAMRNVPGWHHEGKFFKFALPIGNQRAYFRGGWTAKLARDAAESAAKAM